MTTPHSEVLIDVRERLARIETKLDHAAEWREEVRKDLATHQDETAITFTDHAARITVLESRFKQLAAVGSVILFAVTFLQDWIAERFL